MRLAVLKERLDGETRVAATPETVRKLLALGLTVAVEAGAGSGTSIPDAEYSAAGAEIAGDAHAALAGAGVVFAVQVPQPAAFAAIPRGALLVCISGAMADHDLVPQFARAGVDVAALELLPRITRAQSMDILSSQANLAGYRAVIEGAGAFDRGFPMMMTAAGTVPPARVFVIGAGVAGLQAIATARRLGAIVSATDVRPAAKEEIKSLGATFVGVEDSETAGQTGAYARDMSAEFRQKQAELMAATVAKNDMVICTALVQGGRAPVLVTQAMVDAMKPGSVVVDLASDGGGNCAATRPGEAYVTDKGVKILGYRNWPGRISVAASTLYAKNLLTFLTTFWDKAAGAPRLPEDDAIIKGVMLTRGGAVVHAHFAAPAAAAAPVVAEPAAATAADPVAVAAAPAVPAPHAAASEPEPAGVVVPNAPADAPPAPVHQAAAGLAEPPPAAIEHGADPAAPAHDAAPSEPAAAVAAPAPAAAVEYAAEPAAPAHDMAPPEPSAPEAAPGPDISDSSGAPGEIAVPATPIIASAPQPAPEHEAAALPPDPGGPSQAASEPARGGGGKKKGARPNRPTGGKAPPPRAGES